MLTDIFGDSMFKTALDCIVNPSKGIKLASKKTVGQGITVLIAGIIIAALLDGLSAYLGTPFFFAQGIMTNASGEFSSAFSNSLLSLATVFIVLTVTVAVIMNALGHRKNTLKFISTVSFPFAAMSVVVAVINLVIIAIALLQAASLVIGITGYLFFLTTVYAYILYAKSISEHYKVSMEKAAAVIILVIIVANLSSMAFAIGNLMSGISF